VKTHIAYISAGSNIGGKLENCRNGLRSIADSVSSAVINVSPFYHTEPVHCIDQDWFVNAVAKIETLLDPFSLLDELKSIEIKAGRLLDAERFSPRILDLDILLYDCSAIDAPGLVIPHPEMHKRRFVLKPICDIDERIIHPLLKKEMRFLLNLLDGSEQRIEPC